MYDYVVVVVSDEEDVRELERHPPDVRSAEFVVVSESGWNGAAGNGLGTLFALENASKKTGDDLTEEVRERGKSVLVVHTAGEGTRNLLTRACKCKAFIDVPASSGSMRILDGVIAQFGNFSVGSRIFVVWGDQFIFIEDSPEDVRRSALKTHVLLFGLKKEITEDTVRKYGIQMVRSSSRVSSEEKLCDIVDFDDSRDYDVVRRKIERMGGEALVNMGIFMMSGTIASCMRDVFSDELRRRAGKFNSDELWQMLVCLSSRRMAASAGNEWLRERAEEIFRRRCEEWNREDISLISSFPLSDHTVWLDFGTNRSYYESLMLLIESARLRNFLGVECATAGCAAAGGAGADVEDCVLVNANIRSGSLVRSVVSNAEASHARLMRTCMLNAVINDVVAEDSVIYGVVDHSSMRIRGKIVADVFHPEEGRIRLEMGIGDETALPKERWWHSRILKNTFSLREVAEMMKGVSLYDMRDMRRRIVEVARAAAAGDADALNRLFEDKRTSIPLLKMALRGDSLGKECINKGLRDFLREKLRSVNKPLKVEHFIEEKPWGYELWCASPRNTCEIEVDECRFRMRIEELAYLFESFGNDSGRFPLIAKIIKADENLSVQVHPDDEYARRTGDFGKDEAWVVIESSEDAKIFVGFNRNENRESFERAIRTGEILSHLNEYDAKRGDVFYIPAGTIHALGGGTKVYEISSASERTFRIYDYGRGRELHVDDAINVLKFEKYERKERPVLLRKAGESEEYLLVESEKFVLKMVKVRNAIAFEEKVCIITCISGSVKVRSESEEVSLQSGESAIVPANIKFEIDCAGSATGSEVFLAVGR